MRFVNDNVLERELLECRLLNQAYLIRCDEHIKVLWNEPVRDEIGTFFLRSRQKYCVHIWRPLPEFTRPVLQR